MLDDLYTLTLLLLIILLIISKYSEIVITKEPETDSEYGISQQKIIVEHILI